MNSDKLRFNARSVRRPQSSLSGSASIASATTLLVILAAACWLLDWTSELEFYIAISVFLLCATIPKLLPRRLTNRRAAAHILPGNTTGAIVRSACLGLFATVVTLTLLIGTKYLPVYSRYLDGDRTALEAKIQTLTSAANYLAAAKLVEERLARPSSSAWKAALRQIHVDLLLGTAKSTGDFKARRLYLTEAIDCAKDYGLSSNEAEALLLAIDQQEEFEQELATKQSAYITRMSDWLGQLRGAKDYAGLDAMLRLIIGSVPEEKWPSGPLKQQRLDNLVSWGDSLTDLDERALRYSAALDVASQYRLDDRLIQTRMRDVDTARHLRPIVLPPGSRVWRFGVPTPNLHNADVVVDLAVETATSFVHDLKPKDFTVAVGNQPVTDFHLVEMQTVESRPVSVLLLLDESPSTLRLREKMRQAAHSLITESPSEVAFQVVAFSDTSRVISDWGHDEDAIASAGFSDQTQGRTALRSSIASAITSLGTRSGLRVLIVLTDGKDTLGNTPSNAELVSLCRAASVRVLGLGLENKDLDTSLLTTLARETKGLYLSVSNQSELVSRFRRIRTEIARPGYRLRVPAFDHSGDRLTITIGRGDSALTFVCHDVQEGSRDATAHTVAR